MLKNYLRIAVGLLLFVGLVVGMSRVVRAACSDGSAEYCATDCGWSEVCSCGSPSNSCWDCGDPYELCCNGGYTGEVCDDCWSGETCPGDGDSGGDPDPDPTCTSSAPGAPTLVDPPNGYESPTITVTLDWTVPASWGTGCPQANISQVYVDTNPTPTTLVAELSDTTDPDNPNPPSTYVFTGQYSTTYYWRVVANNYSQGTASAEVWSFTTPSAAQGTVYYDPDNTCSPAASTPSGFGGGLTASLRGTGDSSAVTDGGANAGKFAIQAAAGSYTLDLDLGALSGYGCSTCAQGGCLAKSGVLSPSTGNNYFLTDRMEAWWQTVGAGAYSGATGGGVTVDSPLPFGTDRLILPGLGGSAAALVRASGSVAVGSGEVNDEGWVVQSAYRGKTMDYRFFAAQMGVTLGTEDDFLSDTLGKPVSDGRDFFYSEPVSGTSTLDDSWNVAAGESYVVFVNGNLIVPENVTVADGGFLAFIVNGGVTVPTSVTDIQGIFVIDDLFTTETVYPLEDVQLVTGGMIIAWGGVSLNRDLGVPNIGAPAEQFVYRADLLVNMPEKMKSFALRWQEVAPGTID